MMHPEPSHSRDSRAASGDAIDVAGLARGFDWTAHPLGPPDVWPPNLRTAFDLVLRSSFPMFIAWGERRCLLYNDAYAQILGDKHPAAFGAEFRQVWAEVWGDIEPLVLAVDRGESVYLEDLQLRLNRRVGYEDAFFTFSYSPVAGANGAVEGLFCAVVETTERKRTEDAYRASEAKYRLLVETMPNMVWMSDLEGGITYASPRWYEYTGLTPEQTYGKNWASALHPDDLAPTVAVWSEHLKSGEPIEITYRLRGRDGIHRHHVARAVPVRDDDGRITLWLGTLTDIDAQISAIRVRDEFLSIASHELKTPLTGLGLQTQLVKRQLGRDGSIVTRRDWVDRLVQHTETAVSRLNRLVDDMLDIARIRSGRLTLDLERIDLGAVTRDLLTRMEPQFHAAGCGTPRLAVSDPAPGRWDRLRIEQVIANLFTNAMRYGRGKPVDIRVKRVGGRARLTVHDRGIGIAPEVQDKIFDRFERAVDPSEVSGLGLGLFIARQIVEAHGGEIRVESAPGKGSTFHVDLPLETEDPA